MLKLYFADLLLKDIIIIIIIIIINTTKFATNTVTDRTDGA